jgi:hypothetical protein
MATYKFPQFNVEIIDPTVIINNVNDNITNQTCSVDVVLTTPSAVFGVTFDGFTYSRNWSDTEIRTWVNSELAKYLV